MYQIIKIFLKVNLIRLFLSLFQLLYYVFHAETCNIIFCTIFFCCSFWDNRTTLCCLFYFFYFTCCLLLFFFLSLLECLILCSKNIQCMYDVHSFLQDKTLLNIKYFSSILNIATIHKFLIKYHMHVYKNEMTVLGIIWSMFVHKHNSLWSNK